MQFSIHAKINDKQIVINGAQSGINCINHSPVGYWFLYIPLLIGKSYNNTVYATLVITILLTVLIGILYHPELKKGLFYLATIPFFFHYNFSVWHIVWIPLFLVLLFFTILNNDIYKCTLAFYILLSLNILSIIFVIPLIILQIKNKKYILLSLSILTVLLFTIKFTQDIDCILNLLKDTRLIISYKGNLIISILAIVLNLMRKTPSNNDKLLLLISLEILFVSVFLSEKGWYFSLFNILIIIDSLYDLLNKNNIFNIIFTSCLLVNLLHTIILFLPNHHEREPDCDSVLINKNNILYVNDLYRDSKAFCKKEVYFCLLNKNLGFNNDHISTDTRLTPIEICAYNYHEFVFFDINNDRLYVRNYIDLLKEFLNSHSNQD